MQHEMKIPDTKSLNGAQQPWGLDPTCLPSGREHAVLVVLDGRRTSRRYEIKQQELTVGRDDTADIVLHDANCSRRHARFIFTNLSEPVAKPQIALTDLDSRNGTYVNGVRISTKELSNGDKILLGRTLIGFYLWDEVTFRAEDSLLRSASTDALTGLYNRGFFQSTLIREFHRSRRYQRPLSLVLMDVDNFKGINDTYGHPIGDKVLIEISNLLLANARGTDFACRYGGEEAVLILPETDLEGATLYAERLREKLKALAITAGQRTIHLTASFGVAQLRDEMKGPEDLVRCVDSATYHAKKEGRDRVHAQATGWEDSQHTRPMASFVDR